MSSVLHRSSRCETLCANHGTTAAAQRVCVDHVNACVGIAFVMSDMCAMVYLTHVACATSTPAAAMSKYMGHDKYTKLSSFQSSFSIIPSLPIDSK